MNFYDLSNINNQATVTLFNQSMPVLINGNGIPCLCMGIGSLLQRTLSDKFRESFTIYSTDAYWVKQPTDIDLNELTIERICLDMISIAKQLNLNQYYLIGHSVFGGLVMEVAKYQPPGLCGVISIGATPGWDEKIIQFKNTFFDKYASEHRKQRFAKLQQQYNQLKQPTDSLASVNAYLAESPKYFAKEVTLKNMQDLWQGIDCDDRVINHLFNDLLANYRFSENVDTIDVPVIVAGGQKDYDSVPLEIWKTYPTPKQFTLVDCGPVGHWPHMEAHEKFDHGVMQWMNDNNLSSI